MKLECKTCGANLKYVPSAQKAYCEHCGNYFDVREIEYNPEEYDDFEEYTCSSCGATLLTTGKTEIVQCLYCGGKEFVNIKGKKEYMLDGIFPFRIDRKFFKEAYMNYLKENTDKDFLRKMESTEILGFYLPYSFANQFFRKQYPKDLNELFEKILPYDFKGLKRMNPIYLDSFVAETIKTAKEENDIKTNDPSFFWVPVWVASVEYRGDYYYIVMNGQTGEMAGTYSKRFLMKEEKYKKFREEKIGICIIVSCLIFIVSTNIIKIIYRTQRIEAPGIIPLLILDLIMILTLIIISIRLTRAKIKYYYTKHTFNTFVK